MLAIISFREMDQVKSVLQLIPLFAYNHPMWRLARSGKVMK